MSIWTVCFRWFIGAGLLWSPAVWSAAAVIPIAPLARSTAVDFSKEVLPILRNNCLACHNQTKAKAELVLETPQTILKGSENGPVVVPGHSEASLLLEVAAHQKGPTMPPRDNKVAAVDLTAQELGLIRLWIDQGAQGEVPRAEPVAWQPLSSSYEPIFAVAVSPDGQLAACNRANQIFVYQLPSKRLLTCLSDPLLPKPLAHRDSVHALAFSPDGKILASGGYREVKLWRRPTNAPSFQLRSATERPSVVAISPDGAWLATGTTDGKITLMPLPGGKVVNVMSPSSRAVRRLLFSPDNRQLLAAFENGLIRILNLPDGNVLQEAKADSEVTALGWLEGAQLFASGTANGLIQVWAESSKQSMAPVAEFYAGSGEVLSLHGVPHCPEEVLSAGTDGVVRQWEIASGLLLRSMSHGAPVIALAVSSDGTRDASVGLDGTVALWSAASGKEIARLKGNREAQELVLGKERALHFATNEVSYCQVTFDALEKERKAQIDRVRKAAETLASTDKAATEKQKKVDDSTQSAAAAEKAVNELRAELAKAKGAFDTAETKKAAAKQQVQEAETELKKARQLQANAENELTLGIASAQKAADQANEAQNAIPLSQAEAKRVQAELEAAKGAAVQSEKPIRAASFSADDQTLATGGDDRLVHIWNTETGEAGEVLRQHPGSVVGVAFGTCNAVVSISADGTAVGWNLHPEWTLSSGIGTGDDASALSDRVNALAFSPDGQTLATGSGEPSRSGQIQLWNLASGRLNREFNDVHSDTVFGLEFSRSGQFLASSAADRFMRVIDLSAAKVLRSFEGHTHHVLGVAWKQDGRTLATAGADNVVKLWDFHTGERRKNIDGFDKEVTSISAFTGDQFLVTSGDRQVRIVNEKGETVRAFVGAKEFLYSAAATADGKRIVAGGQDGTLLVWDALSGELIAQFPP